MFKKLLQFIGLSATSEPIQQVEIHLTPESTPTVTEALSETSTATPKSKSTRGRKPRATTEATPKKAPRKRKPKSE
jgi:hypothetical protein